MLSIASENAIVSYEDVETFLDDTLFVSGLTLYNVFNKLTDLLSTVANYGPELQAGDAPIAVLLACSKS